MPTGNNSPRNNDLPGQLIAGLDGGIYRPVAVNPAGALITAGGSPVGAPSDAFANPASAEIDFALGGVWNGVAWDFQRGNINGTFQQGAAAIDAAIAGNPIFIGGRASLATPAEVSANGDAQGAWLDRKGRIHVTEGPGDDADLVSGFTAVNGGILITIPVNRTWEGWISLTASLINTANSAAQSALGHIDIIGGASVPPIGTQFAHLALSVAATTATATSGNQAFGSTSMFIRVRATGGLVQLQLITTVGIFTQIAASANGQLL